MPINGKRLKSEQGRGYSMEFPLNNEMISETGNFSQEN